jgi:outer membrane protein OmpA-like peptidoglycan-associated protein
MKPETAIRILFPRQIALLFLASALVIPALSQENQPAGEPQSAPPAVSQQQPASPAPQLNTPSREGFWGRVNPFARKKWVDKRVEPLRDRLNELDELSAKNTRDIQDVDSRAQAGIGTARAAADAANQTATTANDQAMKAGSTAEQASGHVNDLTATVNGLDQYKPVTEVDVVFHGAQPVLSADARKKLDDLATGINAQQGYIVEIEGHSPLGGPAGVQSSSRLTDAVKRYLVLEHQIPVYRMHAVALGNAQVAMTGDESSKPAKVVRSVHIRLMENSLAAQGSAPPHSDDSLKGAERP